MQALLMVSRLGTCISNSGRMCTSCLTESNNYLF
jgi:hypothetical protein